jgi:predicted acylesterase/phospholipase RssA
MQITGKSGIKYLSLEGGGGKGAAYLGAVMALEDKYLLPNPKMPVGSGLDSPNNYQLRDAFNAYFIIQDKERFMNDVKNRQLVWDANIQIGFRKDFKQDLQNLPIKGISGASAGAITALALAMRLSSKDIDEILKRTYKTDAKISVFDTFMDYPQRFLYFNENYLINDTRFPNKPNEANLRGRSIGINRDNNSFHCQHYGDMVSDDKMRKIIAETFMGADKNRGIGRVWSELKNYLFRTVIQTLTKNFGHLLYLLISFVLPDKDHIAERLFDYFSDKKNQLVKDSFALSQANSDRNNNATKHFAKNMFVHGGLFSGFGVREFFSDLLVEYLFPKEFYYQSKDAKNVITFTPLELENLKYCMKRLAEQVTFKQFREWTNCDFVVTGTNIYTGKPAYFAEEQIPEFPIIEAVGISMNIPIVFKPIAIRYGGESLEKKIGTRDNPHPYDPYIGMWVDGGVLNNFPFHAFDHINRAGVAEGRRDDGVARPLNPDILGLRLSDGYPRGTDTEKKDKEAKDKRYDSLKIKIGTILGDLILGTFMYPSEDGQIRNKQEEKQSIELFAYRLNTLNFTPQKDEKDEAILGAYESVQLSHFMIIHE